MALRTVVLGAGHVARSLLSLLCRNEVADHLQVLGVADRSGAVLDLRRPQLRELAARKAAGQSLRTQAAAGIGRFHSWDAPRLIAEVRPDLVIDLTPSRPDDPGSRHLRIALEQGADVVTANKQPLAWRYSELTGLARRHGRVLAFGATVGGAAPVIDLVRYGAWADQVVGLRGVLNGSSSLAADLVAAHPRIGWEGAIAQLRPQGVLEEDWRLDLHGGDLAAKGAILANVLGAPGHTPLDIRTLPITDLSPSEVAGAAETGHVVRYVLAIGEGHASVSPQVLPKTHALATTGAMAAVEVATALLGPLTLHGTGAGAAPTAGALLADLAQVVAFRQGRSVPPEGWGASAARPPSVSPSVRRGPPLLVPPATRKGQRPALSVRPVE